jgi:hypothetical protein
MKSFIPVFLLVKPINVHFAKDKLYKMKEIALDVISKCEMLEFRDSFIFSKMDEVDLILDDIFFEAHIVDGRWKLA